MVDSSQLFAVHQTLKDELGRAVFHELRHVVASGDKSAADDVAALARHVQLAWQEIAVATKLHGELSLSTKWVDLLEAKHRRLYELTREVDQVERSFAWSKVLFAREVEYIRNVTIEALGTAVGPTYLDGDPPADSTFNELQFQESVSIMTRIACRLKEEEDLAALRQAHVAERKALRESLQEAQQGRIDARARRKTELSKLMDWFQGAGVPLAKDDFPPEMLSAVRNAEDSSRVGDDGVGEVRTPRRHNPASARVKGPMLETARRLRYWDTAELERQQRQDEYFFPLENAQTSMAHAAKMYQSPDSPPFSARERPPPALRPMRPPSTAPARSSQFASQDVQAAMQLRRPKTQPLPSQSMHQPKHQVQHRPKQKIQHAMGGPDAKELLLLDSSHRVVSEGARDGALVFWLEPKRAKSRLR